MDMRRVSMRRSVYQRKDTIFVLLLVVLMLSGCSLLFGGRNNEEPTPEADDRVIVPTFTPTTEVPATATPEPTATQPPVVEAAPTEAPPAAEPSPTEVVNAPTPTPIPKVVVSAASANARSGPGTDFALIGAVTQGQAFDVTGKSPDGSWWQFCCVNGQPGWIFGELVNVENGEGVQVAQSIPAAPVAVAPQQPAQPAQPAPTEAPPAEQPPAEQPPAEPPPPAGGAVNAGNCGGDDGCKFKLRGGPSFAANGGGEMKLQLFFMHSGVDGGQPQGDYRLAVERDGQLITTFADTTSIALSKNQGPQGPYNYEGKASVSSLPGGTLEGNYFFWVLDGNRERDSDVFQMYVPPGQGEIWIEFDQG